MQQVRSPFPKGVYVKNAEVYKIMANPVRLEILNVLARPVRGVASNGERGSSGPRLIKYRSANMCYQEVAVEDIVRILGLSKANVSQHLALLRHAGLVSVRREGLYAYYRIVDPNIVVPCRILKKLNQRC